MKPQTSRNWAKPILIHLNVSGSNICGRIGTWVRPGHRDLVTCPHCHKKSKGNA